MKLRNKKTGEIVDNWAFISARYDSLAEMIDEWEDYAPKEPIIKDEKIRDAVRAWAKVNKLTVVRVFYIDETETLKLDSGVNLITISFESEEDYSHLNRETHTITELCGDEE